MGVMGWGCTYIFFLHLLCVFVDFFPLFSPVFFIGYLLLNPGHYCAIMNNALRYAWLTAFFLSKEDKFLTDDLVFLYVLEVSMCV